MRMLNKITLTFTLMILCLGLTACGFHLRGKTPLPEQMKKLYLQSDAPYTPFMIQLEQLLSHMGSDLVKDPADADITLKISGQYFTTSTFSQSASSNTTQYTMQYFYTYELLGKKGSTYYGPKTLSLKQNYTVNEDAVLSNGNETSQIQEELQSNAVYQLVEQFNSQDLITALQHPPKAVEATTSPEEKPAQYTPVATTPKS